MIFEIDIVVPFYIFIYIKISFHFIKKTSSFFFIFKSSQLKLGMQVLSDYSSKLQMWSILSLITVT